VQVIRTIVWATLVILIVLLILFNVGNTADLNVWPEVGAEPPVIIAGPMWAFALGFVILGFVPMWLVYRAQSWRLKRRIASLENSLHAAVAVAPIEPPQHLPSPETAPEAAETAASQSPTDESNRQDVS
jgi:lipopolysaccharide assembly protein A